MPQWVETADAAEGRNHTGSEAATIRAQPFGSAEGRDGGSVSRSGGSGGGGSRGADVGGRQGEGNAGLAQGSEAGGGEPLPVSAVELGLAPGRGGEGTLSGADIAMDALAEEEVAHLAHRFFQQ